METSLYIHIPFCRKKCDYCDFYSVAKENCREGINSLDDEYIDAVLNQVKFLISEFSVTWFKTVYIGGGTPSLLTPSQLFRLVSNINSSFYKPPVEFTVEMNPDDITVELIEAAKKSGVTRISCGIQALDDKVLKLINRECSVQQVLNALEILKNSWDRSLSVDFIAGLPGQSFNSFEKQFEILKKYKINHVSLYALSVEEATPLYQNINNGKISFDYEKADRMWIKGRNILEKSGFAQYEVSNFSCPGAESIHNGVYWSLENYLSAGCGGTMSVYDQKSFRFTNTLSVKVYKEYWNKNKPEFNTMPGKREEIDLDTQEFEYLMMGFRQLKGISKNKYFKRFKKDLFLRLGGHSGVFSQYLKKNLAEIVKKQDDEIFRLNKKGIMLLNPLLESLL